MRKLLRQALELVAEKSSGKDLVSAPIFLLDKWGHKLNFPKRVQHPICDVFDEWVGLYDDSDIPDDYYERDCSD
jgi:hypothetical protein